MLELLVFDLDGTLVDSRDDLASAVNHALASVGRPPHPVAAVQKMVGDGVRTLIERALGAADDEVEPVLAAFLAHYEQHLADRSRPYAGIEEALDRLVGVRKVVATNKRGDLARRLLALLGLEQRFEAVLGEDDVGRRKPDPAMVREVLRRSGVAAERAWLVGDSVADLRAARAAGVRSCAVLWGYGAEVDLRAEGPDAVLSRPDDLVALVAEALVAEALAAGG
jgi:phosphoglycolate phosphatase